MSKHALLSPSSSERWINCSGSILLPQFEEERDTTAADEGTLMHRISELKLSADIWIDNKEELKDCKNDPLYDPIMEKYSDEYVEFIENKDYDIKLVEEIVDLNFIYPDFFGTADCILMSENGLEVIDLKYGRYKVPVINNTQLMIYALGAVRLYQNKFPDKRDEDFPITLSIYQPRINNIDSWEIKWKDLSRWSSEVLIPAICKIKYEVVEENGGDYCRFCPANVFCGEYNSVLITDTESDIKALDNLQIENNLSKLEDVERYIKRIKSYITKEIKSGEHYEDYKLVEGRKTRYWEHEDQLKELLKDNGLLDKTIEIISPAKMEKALSKEEMENYKEFIGTKTGNPLLVKRTDRREELIFEN